jgi:hypothetical protein
VFFVVSLLPSLFIGKTTSKIRFALISYRLLSAWIFISFCPEGDGEWWWWLEIYLWISYPYPYNTSAWSVLCMYQSRIRSRSLHVWKAILSYRANMSLFMQIVCCVLMCNCCLLRTCALLPLLLIVIVSLACASWIFRIPCPRCRGIWPLKLLALSSSPIIQWYPYVSTIASSCLA